ncbi:MAG TPA: TIGR02391 family protein [Caulobacteraceae bacterium]
MANTGLRPDEASRLQYRDVSVIVDDATHERILEIVVRGKRGVGYCKSMTGAVLPFQRLRKRNNPQSSDLIFGKVQRELLNAILTELELKRDREGNLRTAYSLRHTYISMRLMDGADIYQVAKNCRTSVEMIEKFYASHIANTLDAAAINVRKKPKPRKKPSAEKALANAMLTYRGGPHRRKSHEEQTMPAPLVEPSDLESDSDLDPQRMVGIEYHGIAGATEACQTAVVRLLQCATVIATARIITSGNDHCLFLTTGIGDQIAIKSGFASGYCGTGPTGLSLVLQLLHAHGTEIDEWRCDDTMIERLDRSALTVADVDTITTGRAVRPSRWYDYVRRGHEKQADERSLWIQLPPVIPYSIIDPRIMDLALAFWTDPDAKLLKGYRRLEDQVRGRTGFEDSSAKLFSRAFTGRDAPLTWLVKDDAERSGRASLFTGAFMAYRNPRAHREGVQAELLAEFLLLNQLYRLEAESIDALGALENDPENGDRP